MRACLALTLFLTVVGCRHVPEPGGPSAPSYKSALHRLSAVGPTPFTDLTGRVVLVNFLATWCFPCIVELPALESLQKAHERKDFTVVAVGLDLEGARVLAPFADYYRPTFPLLVATKAMREGDSPFGVIRALPSSVLLGRDGEVKAAWSGVASPRLVEEAIARALKDG